MDVKKTISEQEAAARFVQYIIKQAQDKWPTIHKSLKDAFDYEDKFIVEDEKMAPFDLALAAIAQDLQALKNIFPKNQAEKIEKSVLEYVNSKEWGEYAVDEVKKYCEIFQKAIQNIDAGENPLNVIPVRLLRRWLGKNIKNFDVEINGKKTGLIDPLIIDRISEILVLQFSGTWRRVILHDDIELIEGDLLFRHGED